MKYRIYICPRALADAALRASADTDRPSGTWRATTTPGPAEQVLAAFVWPSWQAQEAFEAQGDVLVLGDEWELVPAAGLVTLEAHRQSIAIERAQLGTAKSVQLLPPQKDVSIAIDTTHTVREAVRKAAPDLLVER